MADRLRALITNDDGISSPGLHALAAAAIDYGFDVVVAAPLTEASGSSAALTAVIDNGRVLVERRTIAALDGAAAFGVGASPGYIVILAAIGAFGPPPDLVLSGINRGANVGHAVIHSGTVGAVFTGANAGRRGMAISLDLMSPAAAASVVRPDDDAARNWATAANVASSLFGCLIESPVGTVLNVNVPDMTVESLRGLRNASLATFGQTQMAIAEVGHDFVRTVVQESARPPTAGTDIAWLVDGYATVTAVRAAVEADDVKFTW